MDIPVVTPMVGKVLEIKVKVGDRVDGDTTLLLLEAMKMEIPIFSTTSGFIKAINISVGQSVKAEEVLVLIDEAI